MRTAMAGPYLSGAILVVAAALNVAVAFAAFGDEEGTTFLLALGGLGLTLAGGLALSLAMRHPERMLEPTDDIGSDTIPIEDPPEKGS